MRKGLLSMPAGAVAALAALLAAVSAVVLSVASAAPAVAAECPNEALRGGPSAGLPDCRAYEQVSPSEKHGSWAVPKLNVGYFPAQSTKTGAKLMFMSFGAFSGAVSSGFPNAYVAQRSADGWATANVTPPAPQATAPGGDFLGYDFNEELTRFVTKVPLQPLTANATPGLTNLFMANLAGEYSWINDVQPTVVPPAGCPPSELSGCYQHEDLVAFAGATNDFKRVFFEATASLAPGAPEGVESLYEAVEAGGGWQVKLAGILPDGEPAAGGSTMGSGSSAKYETINRSADGSVATAISSDGSHVVFQATADAGGPDPAQSGTTQVYDRIDGSETIEISAPAPGAKPARSTAKPATFWGASADGSRIFFTSRAELTTPSYTGSFNLGEDLYEYNAKTEALTDLTVVAPTVVNKLFGGHVIGVVGVSSNGAYVYFVAKSKLVEGKGVANGFNLYVVHNDGAPVYIGTLGRNDRHDWGSDPAMSSVEVSPDGRHLLFMSEASLPTERHPGGYENTIEATGQPASEVYEYAAPTPAEEAAEESGTLTCISCDPSGARPLGSAALGGVSATGQSESTPFHHVDAMTANEGRIFFTSPDPLVSAAAANAQRKLYELERDGEGTCATASGCIFLISNPDAEGEAALLATDENGDNVFFTTQSRLVPSDEDNLVDVYDARVDGGVRAAPVEVACISACRSAGLTSAPPASPSLLSGFSGPSGNLAASRSESRGAGKHAKSTGRSRKQAKRRRRRLRRCRRHARNAHRHSARKRKRALRRCKRRYGHAARWQAHARRLHRHQRKRSPKAAWHHRRANKRRGR